jgi:hypothetical protein
MNHFSFQQMTRTCCVPKCKTNLRSEIKIAGRLQVFNFPDEEKQRSRWLKGLNIMHPINISTNNGVCVKHFKPRFLKPVEQNDSAHLNLRKCRLRLTKDACPSIVGEEENSISRCSPETKNKERQIKMRETNLLVLPHPSYLKRMEGKVSKLGTGLDESHKNYIREKRKLLDPRSSVVSVLVDEIYSKPEVRYSGGQLHGIALNSSKCEAATTVQAFMIKSLFSKNRDMVALYPVRTLTSQVLLSMTLEVLQALVETGYTAVSLVSDNNRVNRKMFEMLCDGILQHSIPHPYQPGDKLFLLFDTVHGFKNIRNNWLNNYFQTFLFPDPYKLEEVKSATFYHLKLVYEKEKEALVKMAPGLCNKALSPSSLERQDVSLVLKIANEKTISALEEYKEAFPGIDIAAIEGTVCFLKMYVSWWNVVNVKSVSKGFNLRNSLMKPVHKEDCLQLDFLRLFSAWLDAWDKVKISVPEGTVPKRKEARLGKLTNDTHLAIKHTTDALVAVATYCLTRFSSLGIKYVLLGLFQDDSIERRFGRYRTMNGASYHITVDQILQTERKLKVISLLKFKLKEENTMSIDKLREFSSDETFHFSDKVLDQFQTAYEESLLLEVNEDTIKVLVSIAGYCAKKLRDKNKCDHCFSIVSTNNALEDIEIPESLLSYMQNYNRGGLKIPTDITLHLTIGAYRLFTLLTSEKYQKDFINAGHQKQLFLHLAKDVVSMFDVGNELCLFCENPVTSILSSCLFPLSNIFLNNFTKKFNDKSHGDKLKQCKERKLKKQRKLNTLKK